MHIDLISLYPHYIDSCLEHSLLGRAQKEGHLSISSHNLRSFCQEGERVDGRLVGGGAGMLLRYSPCVKAIAALKKEGTSVLMMAPSGKKATPELLKRYSKNQHLVLLSGHYEGFDARVEEHVDEVISVCDLVLTQGVLASMVFIDAMARYIPGVIGKSESLEEESYSIGLHGSRSGYERTQESSSFVPLLEAPHYCDEKHNMVEEMPEIPHRAVLQSGHHANIQSLRFLQSLQRTQKNRPDLYSYLLSQMQSDLFPAKQDLLSLRLFLPVTSLALYRKIFSTQLRLPTWEEKGKILALRVDSTLLVLYEEPVNPSVDPVGHFEAHLPISAELLNTFKSVYVHRKKDWDKAGDWQIREQGVLFCEKRGRFALVLEGNFTRV